MSIIQERSSSVCLVSLRVRLVQPLKAGIQLRWRQARGEAVPCSSLRPLPVFTSPRRRLTKRQTAFSSLSKNKERTAMFPKKRCCDAFCDNRSCICWRKEVRKKGSREHYTDLNLWQSVNHSVQKRYVYLQVPGKLVCADQKPQLGELLDNVLGNLYFVI